MHYTMHTVVRLPIHLENEELIVFDAEDREYSTGGRVTVSRRETGQPC